jgi:hypothetical protein
MIIVIYYHRRLFKQFPWLSPKAPSWIYNLQFADQWLSGLHLIWKTPAQSQEKRITTAKHGCGGRTPSMLCLVFPCSQAAVFQPFFFSSWHISWIQLELEKHVPECNLEKCSCLWVFQSDWNQKIAEVWTVNEFPPYPEPSKPALQYYLPNYLLFVIVIQHSSSSSPNISFQKGGVYLH